MPGGTAPCSIGGSTSGSVNRFLIDDYDSPNVLAYRLTKPFKLGGTFMGSGVLSFVLQECNTEDSDDLERHIANYYDYFPRTTEPEVEPPIEQGAVPPGKPDMNSSSPRP